MANKNRVLFGVGYCTYIKFRRSPVVTAGPCLRRLVAGFSLRRPRISPRSCEICDGRSGIGRRVSLKTSASPSISIIPPELHTHLSMPDALTRKTNGRGLRSAQKPKGRTLDMKVVFTLGAYVVPCQHQSTDPPSSKH